ncbi:hypothetical protein ACFY8B_31335 [Streptomyces sp. NPDC012751]|uniref:hypothetical protein n=1 Tax=Streptomyces sp. NPDC012751 TaxID=3364846 RepID=UPI0036D11A4F
MTQEERDGYDGESEPGAEDIDEYTEPELYDEEPEFYDEDGVVAADGADAADDGGRAGGRAVADASPDVYLDVPLLKVDEIDLDVEDLRAHVSLQAEVLDLLKLNVGADVSLGRVHLGISGVEAQALLKVRLDNVAVIINRVLTTLDRNPEILHELARGVGSAVQDVGGGARYAIGELGTGAGRAVQDVGRGAGGAVRDVGRGVGSVAEDVGRGAGAAVRDVGHGAGAAVRDVGQGAGTAVRDVGHGAGSVAEDVGRGAGDAVRDVGAGAGRAVEDVGGEVGRAVGEVGETVGGATGDVTETAAGVAGTGTRRGGPAGRRVAREAADEERDRTVRSPSGTRTRRARGEDGKLPPRSGRRRASREGEEPP